MLTFLLIIAFTCFEIISGEDDNKFIDSLPASQKKEFLQKVEKRIQNEVPEVKSPEANDTNVNHYEKRLEDQGKSVQNILRSEIESLKSHHRRSENDTARQAHIDLTLRAKDENREARRENVGHKKNILTENIPVAVQYQSEHVSKVKSKPSNKNESKSNVITWVNQITKTGDSNTSAERKRTGRRSNDFEFDNVTLGTPDITATTDAVEDSTVVITETTKDNVETTKDNVEITKHYVETTKDDVETTKEAVELAVTSESPTTQNVASDTTRQEVSTQADDENSRTAQGNINTMTDALDNKNLDYVSTTQNIAGISSTIDSSKFNDTESSVTLESIDVKSDYLVDSTAQYDKNLTRHEFSDKTHYYVNPQVHSVNVRPVLHIFDNSTTLDNIIATDAINSNKAVINTNVTVDNIYSSAILNNVTITTNKPSSSTNKSTETNLVNRLNNNSIDRTKIYNANANVDDEYHSLVHHDLYTITHNLQSTEPGNVHGVMYKDHQETTQDNFNGIINNQSGRTKLGDKLHGPSSHNDPKTNILRSNSKVDVEKQQNVTADNNAETHTIPSTTLGAFINKHHLISVDDKNTVDIDAEVAEPHSGHDGTTVANIIETTDSQQANRVLGYVKANKTRIPDWLVVVPEALYETTRNVHVPIHNNHKINKEHNNTTLSQTVSKDTNIKHSTDTIYSSLTIHDPDNTIYNERQLKYVPVYKYDPENAYFHPTTGRPSDDNIIDKIGSGNPTVIKKTETRSRTTKFDVYADGNKKSLRIKDIKERVISASNTRIKPNSNLYDVITGEGSAESSNDDVSYEKPLKHSLKKIREKLYKHQMKNKSNDNKSGNDISRNEAENKYKDEVRKKYSAMPDKDEKKSISELFSNFGALLEQLVVHDNNKKSPSKTKMASDENVRSDREVFRDVKLSLENHNRGIQNKGIQQIVETLEKIQHELDQKRHKKTNTRHNVSHQSRFQVKNRDGNREDEVDKMYSIRDHINKPHVIGEEAVDYEDVNEKSKPIKIEDEYLEVHANILKNLVDVNDEGLEKYDWLGTTVLIQAGLAKIQDITEKKIRNIEIHPLDEQLLEFAMNLHETALHLIAEENERSMPVKRKRLSFRIPKPKKGRYFNALNRMYGEMTKTKFITMIRSRYSIEDFRAFVIDLRSFLHDLHTAIKEISSITTYQKQNWFDNLKQLYLHSAGVREYLELLLHFVSARLVGLIDERAKKIGREGDFMKRDREADRIEVEFVMVVKICNALIQLNYSSS